MRRESEVGVGGVEGGTVPETLDKVHLTFYLVGRDVTLRAQQSRNQVQACSRAQEAEVTRRGGGGRRWKTGPEGPSPSEPGRGGGLEGGLPGGRNPSGQDHGGSAE